MARGALKMRRIEYSVRLRGASINSVGIGPIGHIGPKFLIFGSGLKRENRGRVAVVPDFRGRVAVIVRWSRLRFVDVSEPFAGRLTFPFRNFEENRLNLFGNRPASALAHRDPVDGTNR